MLSSCPPFPSCPSCFIALGAPRGRFRGEYSRPRQDVHVSIENRRRRSGRDRDGRPAVHRPAAGHPSLHVRWLAAASDRTDGIRDASPWRLSVPMPDAVPGRRVEAREPGRGPRLVFSALDANVADEFEHRSPPRVTLSSATRATTASIRLSRCSIPEINADHLAHPGQQRRRTGGAANRHESELLGGRSGDGARAAARRSARDACLVTTLQAVSGAGYPGSRRWTLSATSFRSSAAAKRRRFEVETLKILGGVAAVRALDRR